MNKIYYVLIGILFVLLITYIVDRKVFMRKRVLRHNLWEHTGGERIRGDFIETQYVVRFEKDIMIFDYKNGDTDKLILKYQYFSTMKIIDPKTKKTGKYSMKGANWIDYFLGKRKKNFKKG